MTGAPIEATDEARDVAYALCQAIERQQFRAASVAHGLARERFPHRARNCCFKIGGSEETAALRRAYAEILEAELEKRRPMIERLRRQIRGRIAHAASAARKAAERRRRTIGANGGPALEELGR